MFDTELLTTQEYARATRRSQRTIERERETGEGCPFVRLGRRVLYRRSDIEGYIAAHVRGRHANANHEPQNVLTRAPNRPLSISETTGHLPAARDRHDQGKRTRRRSAQPTP